MRKHSESTKNVASYNFPLFEARKLSIQNKNDEYMHYGVSSGLLHVGERALDDPQDSDSLAWIPPHQ